MTRFDDDMQSNKPPCNQELNLILTTVLFTDSISFIILSVDGLTSHKTLNMHKFSADFLICISKCSSCMTLLCIIILIPICSQRVLRSRMVRGDPYFPSQTPMLDQQHNQHCTTITRLFVNRETTIRV